LKTKGGVAPARVVPTLDVREQCQACLGLALEAAAIEPGIHPREGGNGSELRCRARDVDGQNVAPLFKALKQNLKIKTFVGTSANAVKTQIWTALISMLLLRYLQLSSRFDWSLANLVALLRMNLFTHRDLVAWLNQPFATPPDPQESPQRNLALA
jgi:hypothetical protein